MGLGERLTHTNYRARAGMTAEEVAHLLLEARSPDPQLPTVALRLAHHVTLAKAEDMAAGFNEGEDLGFRGAPEMRLVGDQIPVLHFPPPRGR